MPSSTDTASTAKRGRPGYDQQSVLRIAVDVFNRHGYDATSMGILADNLGISKSAIYHHVPSKGDLLKLALEHALGGLEAILEEPLGAGGGVEPVQPVRARDAVSSAAPAAVRKRSGRCSSRRVTVFMDGLLRVLAGFYHRSRGSEEIPSTLSICLSAGWSAARRTPW